MERRRNFKSGMSKVNVTDLQLHDLIVETETLTAGQKNAIMLEFGATDKMLIDGGDETLGLLDLCLRIGGILVK